MSQQNDGNATMDSHPVGCTPTPPFWGRCGFCNRDVETHNVRRVITEVGGYDLCPSCYLAYMIGWTTKKYALLSERARFGLDREEANE